MVNFRYHLVSLIAVFLALAVGVVLGAGPLQNAVDQGSEAGQAQKIQALEDEAAEASQVQDEYVDFVQALSSDILPGTLQGKTVALVMLPGAPSRGVDLVGDAVEAAGGEVLGRVLLTSDWETTDASTYRDTLAGPVASHLEGEPKDASSVGVLALALVEALTTEGSKAEMLQEMLTDDATPLVEKSSWPKEPVTDIVLIGAGKSDAADPEDPQSGGDIEDPARDRAWLALGSALSQAAPGSVAVGKAANDTELIAVLRSGDVNISTVDQLPTPMAALNVALALGDKEVGSFGQGVGAKNPLAPLPLKEE